MPNAENLYFMRVPEFVVMNTRTSRLVLHAQHAPHYVGSVLFYARVLSCIYLYE